MGSRGLLAGLRGRSWASPEPAGPVPRLQVGAGGPPEALTDARQVGPAGRWLRGRATARGGPGSAGPTAPRNLGRAVRWTYLRLEERRFFLDFVSLRFFLVSAERRTVSVL